jgi:transposase
LQVQEGLGRDPFAGDVFVFRGRAGSLIKALWHDGIGLSRFDGGRFVWPATVDAVVALSATGAIRNTPGGRRARARLKKKLWGAEKSRRKSLIL